MSDIVQKACEKRPIKRLKASEGNYTWNGILKVQSTNAQKSDKIKTNPERKKSNEVQQGIQGGSLKAIR